jgi:hypothetical protein
MATLLIDSVQTIADGVLYGFHCCLRAPVRILRRLSGRDGRCALRA